MIIEHNDAPEEPTGNDDSKGSAMIALLPMETSWCKIALPHLTLVYAGEIADLPETTFLELAKDASALAETNEPLRLYTRGLDVFGGRGYDTEVNVMRFEPTDQLLTMRKYVARWDKSEYAFNPHCTIGPVDETPESPPPALIFDRIMVAWKDRHLTFWLKHWLDQP